MGEIIMTERHQQQVHIITKLHAGELDIHEAAASLGKSERQVRRLRAAFLEHGPAGLVHGNTGRPPTNVTDPETVKKVKSLLETTYAGCNDSHFKDLLAEREQIALSRSTVRNIRQASGLATPRPRRRREGRRSRRLRCAQEGMMLQMDGSPHNWLEDRGPRLTLVSAIDDATGVLWGLFRESETLEAYMTLLWSISLEKGLPECVYTDRTAIVAGTQRRFRPVKEEQVGHASQFARACAEVGVNIILAHSPQAKGRTERSHGTLQDRLVSELRIAGIATLKDANDYLQQDYLPRHNSRFSIAAADATPAWKEWSSNFERHDVFCLKEQRVVNNDNSIRANNVVLDLKPPPGTTLARQAVTVHRRFDGTIAVFWQNHCVFGVTDASPNRLKRTNYLNS
jgi:transposase